MTDQMTDEELGVAVNEALNGLADRARTAAAADTDDELAAAGEFVARFGALGDLFEEPHLTKVQFSAPVPHALGLLGHWSVARNDPEPQPPASYEEHVESCAVCRYLEGVYSLHTAFKYELCHECGLDLDGHDIGVMGGGLGTVHAMCREPWQRGEPEVGSGGDCGGDNQVSDSYTARWWAPLADNLFALVTRYFYLVDVDGKVSVEQQVEYLVCRDLADPGSTEVASDGDYFDMESDNPEGEDLEDLARRAAAPERGVWASFMPHYADFVLGGQG